MTYAMLTLRRDLESLSYKKKVNPFLWEQDKDVVHENLSSQFPGNQRRKNYLNDLTEYCWLVYRKALSANGPMLIGRVSDVQQDRLLKPLGLGREKSENSWNPNAQGNILMVDKWTDVINDCWVLGGIHRHADFHLMSAEAPSNLWNHEQGYHIVTAREILGLLNFGYKREKHGKQVIYRCKNPSSADRASLLPYRILMKKAMGQGPSSITKLISEQVTGFNEEIRAFDYSSLKSFENNIAAR
ncbi:hypothetical protein [Photorhabdus namnaonensis]|uniref:Uncharacterized protein n=1 Tax=Photorhabdus namnaonensis TaxID=1851568 RepID=A0A1B8YCY5_9GAMM|nr:hypothetical protein [Photorhabdus namnaonensis]OCA52927.1 hypothetical protein Phpb_03979 [Photorhabdus namnaonensis]